MRKETDTEKKLKAFISNSGHHYSDTRIDNREVTKTMKKARSYHYGYWSGVIAGRADPCVRALRIYYNEEKKRPIMRLFSYDELVATATLIRTGLPKRVAAAMAFHEKAVAVPSGSPFDPGGRKANDFRGMSVELADGSQWDVAYEPDFELDQLKYIGDYAVWFNEDGIESDPDEARFPDNGLALIALREVDNLPA